MSQKWVYVHLYATSPIPQSERSCAVSSYACLSFGFGCGCRVTFSVCMRESICVRDEKFELRLLSWFFLFCWVLITFRYICVLENV